MITGVARTVSRELGRLYYETLRRIGELVWYNPKHLVLFIGRLVGAALLRDPDGGSAGAPVAYAPESAGRMDPTGAKRRPRGLTVRIVRMMVKSFFRGVVPVTMIGVVGGIAVGSLAGSIGPLVRTAIESPAMVILLANIIPLILAILLAARNGAAIASRLALLPAAGSPPRLSRDTLLLEGLPSLVAAPFVGALFYIILAACLVAGYVVGGMAPIRVEVTADLIGRIVGFLRDYLHAMTLIPEYAQLHGAWPIFRDGALKSILFGAIVAYIAMAFGVRAAESTRSWKEEYYEFNNAVWESVVTALTICGIITFLLWTNV
jgi:hypothetical protein